MKTNAFPSGPAPCWELVADEISRMGYSYGYHKLMLRGGVEVWQVDARRSEGHWYVVRAETLLTAFIDLKERLERADPFPW